MTRDTDGRLVSGTMIGEDGSSIFKSSCMLKIQGNLSICITSRGREGD